MLPIGGSEMRRTDKPDMLTAAEIASWAYCPEAWRLEHGLGLEPENRAARHAGGRHHARKAAAERLAGMMISLGGLLMALAALGPLLLLWWWG